MCRVFAGAIAILGKIEVQNEKIRVWLLRLSVRRDKPAWSWE
jgi:hypothetical protein